MIQTMKINKTVKCDGTSLWGDTKGRPVTITSIDFERADEMMFTKEPYYLIWVNHNRKWTIYTDKGFEKAVTKIVSQKVGKPVKIMFTEQGMQEDGRASMECRFKTCDRNLRSYFTKNRRGK